MCDYPKSLPEFQKMFPDDDALPTGSLKCAGRTVSNVPPVATTSAVH